MMSHAASPSPSPSSPPSPPTHPPPNNNPNYILAITDQSNHASQHVLRKCGFEYVETLEGGFESPVLGVRDSVVFRVWRDGMVGRGEEEEEEGEGFVPPLQ